MEVPWMTPLGTSPGPLLGVPARRLLKDSILWQLLKLTNSYEPFYVST